MAIQVLKEGTRMPGFNLIATGTPAQNPKIIAGNAVELATSDPSGASVQLYTATGGVSVMGIALESTPVQIVPSTTPGVQNVTEYNRGGLISFTYGGTALLRAYVDSFGNPFSATINAFAVGGPVYALPVAADVNGHFDGTAQLQNTNAGGAVLIGKVTKVEGSYPTLAVTFIPVI